MAAARAIASRMTARREQQKRQTATRGNQMALPMMSRVTFGSPFGQQADHPSQELCISESSTRESLLGQHSNPAADSYFYNTHNGGSNGLLTDHFSAHTNGYSLQNGGSWKPYPGSLQLIHVVDAHVQNTPYNTTVRQIRDEELSLCVSDYASNSYGSIFTQIREVNRESRSEMEFLLKALRILRMTAVMSLFLMLVLMLPLGMVILGVKYLHECPKEPYLPIYLLVGGCFWLLKMFTVLWRQMRERKSSDSSADTLDDDNNQSDFITNRSTQFTDMVLSLFLLVWFGFGNYWVWRIWKPNFSMQLHEPQDWCEQTLYMFCVVQIIACYGCFILFLFSICCLCCARHICCFTDKLSHRR